MSWRAAAVVCAAGAWSKQVGAMAGVDLPIEPLRRQILITEPLDAEQSAALFELTGDRTAAAGMPAYEISNHAAAGAESRHNLTYWRYGDYAGIGPGAHGRTAQTTTTVTIRFASASGNMNFHANISTWS